MMYGGAAVAMFEELHDPRGAVHKKTISEGAEPVAFS
jgi:hypothetical protein